MNDASAEVDQHAPHEVDVDVDVDVTGDWAHLDPR
jgi:hypothetical protein